MAITDLIFRSRYRDDMVMTYVSALRRWAAPGTIPGVRNLTLRKRNEKCACCGARPVLWAAPYCRRCHLDGCP